MSDSWQILSLENCLEKLIDYRGKTPNKTESGVPLITAKVVKEGRITSINEYISEKEYEYWMIKGKPKKGDILLTTEAPLGQVAQLHFDKVALAQRIIAMRGKKNVIDNAYLKYYLRSIPFQNELKARATGTTVLGIKQSELKKIEIQIPPIRIQKYIAEVLGSFDDKIDLNRKMNETLEEIAQTLFKSWFIDFDPVHARAKGKKPHGMSEEIASLFPKSFEEFELGIIPKGWSKTSMKSVSELIKGRSYKSSELGDSDTALVSLKCFQRNGGYREDGLKPFKGKFNPKQEVKQNEILISITDVTQNAEVIGRPILIQPHRFYKKLVASLDTVILRPTVDIYSNEFL